MRAFEGSNKARAMKRKSKKDRMLPTPETACYKSAWEKTWGTKEAQDQAKAGQRANIRATATPAASAAPVAPPPDSASAGGAAPSADGAA